MNLSLSDLLSKREERILEKALSCPEIRDLYERANQVEGVWEQYYSKGRWKIRFENHVPFEAMCSFSRREIRLSKSISDDDALTFFVFELTNASQLLKFNELYKKFLFNEIDCEEYVKQTEKIEHTNILLHRKIIQKAIDQMGWDQKLDIFQSVEENFEKYWEFYQTTEHAQYYRKWCWERRAPSV